MAQRSVLYTAHGNESVRTFAETVDGLLTQSHDTVRGLVVRVPARKEKDKHPLPFDDNEIRRAKLFACTHGAVNLHLGYAYSDLAKALPNVDVALRDEVQQLGTPSANSILAQIGAALDVMIGDHRQPAGGSRPNYHFVTELLERKKCGLNAIPTSSFRRASTQAAV